MKYILTRMGLLILSLIAINYISDYVAKQAEPEYGSFDFEGTIWFFRLALIAAIISAGIFTFEAYKFQKRGALKARNKSLILILLVALLLVIFGNYFLEFAF